MKLTPLELAWWRELGERQGSSDINNLAIKRIVEEVDRLNALLDKAHRDNTDMFILYATAINKISGAPHELRCNAIKTAVVENCDCWKSK